MYPQLKAAVLHVVLPVAEQVLVPPLLLPSASSRTLEKNRELTPPPLSHPKDSHRASFLCFPTHRRNTTKLRMETAAVQHTDNR